MRRDASPGLRLPPRVWLCALAAAVAGVAVFVNSLHGKFVMDDAVAVVGNQDLRPETPLSALMLNDFWGTPLETEKSHKSFRPLTVLTWRWNYALSGLDVWGYHVGNVAGHALSTGLATLCAAAVLGDVRAAAAAGLLFAVHPVHCEAVASVVGRAEVVSGALFFAAFLAYAAAALPHRTRPALLLAALLLAFLAMLAKEGGLTVLGLFVAWDRLVVAPSAARSAAAEARRQRQRQQPGEERAPAAGGGAAAAPASAAMASGSDPAAAAALRATAAVARAANVRSLLRCLLSLAVLGGSLAWRARITGSSFGPTFSDVDNHIHYGPTPFVRALTYAYLHGRYALLLVWPGAAALAAAAARCRCPRAPLSRAHPSAPAAGLWLALLLAHPPPPPFALPLALAPLPESIPRHPSHPSVVVGGLLLQRHSARALGARPPQPAVSGGLPRRWHHVCLRHRPGAAALQPQARWRRGKGAQR
jgi:hypothetical protein